MRSGTKSLIERNKEAYKKEFYSESLVLSYTLIHKALRQICHDEKIKIASTRIKLGDCIKALTAHTKRNPIFKRRVKSDALKAADKFNSDFKAVNKELKYHYPKIKIEHAARQGMHTVLLLNTTLIKLRSNS